MKKADRTIIYEKYDKHCAYCGKAITMKGMHVDHQYPLSRYIQPNMDITDHNEIKNLYPSCFRCNHYKRAMTLEEFRSLMKTLIERCKKIYIVKVAIDYGILKEETWSGMFYFEFIEITKEYLKVRRPISEARQIIETIDRQVRISESDNMKCEAMPNNFCDFLHYAYDFKHDNHYCHKYTTSLKGVMPKRCYKCRMENKNA